MLVEKPKKGKDRNQMFAKGSSSAALRSAKSHAARKPRPVTLAPVKLLEDRDDEHRS